MSLLRRVFLSALAATSIGAAAQTAANWPNRAIKMIVPFPAGGGYDFMARNLAQKLTESMGQPVVVENRAGANGNIGSDAVAKSAPDGYTLLLGGIGPQAFSVALYPKLPFDPQRDFAPVSLVASQPNLLLTHPSLAVKTVAELALAAQRMAGAVIVGGDFRALLNALSNIDEAEIARYLPFRPGTTGVHYLEGLAQAVRAQPAAVQAALVCRVRYPQTAAETALARTVTTERLAQARAALLLHGGALRGLCADDYAELQREIYAGVLPRRIVAVLGDPVIEAVVADLIAPQSTVTVTSFWQRISTWWRS